MKPSKRLYIIFTFFVSLWCIGILAAPVLKHSGYTRSADVLYSLFSPVCHQDDARSFHIEGEKLGACIRCTLIYFGFLVSLLFMPLFGMFRRTCVPNTLFLLSAILPMVLDVVLNSLGIHSSTLLTRVVTGALFGVAMPWFVVPVFIEACLQLNYRNKNYLLDTGVVTYVRKTQ
jgi:uncharacterized membrane protein